MSKVCDCFEKALEKVKAKELEALKNENIVEDSIKVDWKDRVFVFSDTPNFPVSLYVETEYRPLKKDGTPAKNKKKSSIGMLMSHCPFCGTAINKD